MKTSLTINQTALDEAMALLSNFDPNAPIMFGSKARTFVRQNYPTLESDPTFLLTARYECKLRNMANDSEPWSAPNSTQAPAYYVWESDIKAAVERYCQTDES